MSDQALHEVLEVIDPEYYLDREGIDYRLTHGSSGQQLNVRECPVCGNSEWKVYLNADTGLGNCFAGSHPPGENFNKFSFAKAHLDAESNHAVVEHLRQIAQEIGWRPRKTKSVAVEMDPADLEMPLSFELPINGKNLAYLADRGIDLEVAQYFNLRYCHHAWFKYELNGEEKFQYYGKRVLIPIFDMDGKLVSFQGRDITGTADKKYLFPPGYSSTGKYLFNGHNAHRSKRIIVGEGAFDVMAIKIALDIDVSMRDITAVGTFGKHLSHGNDGGDQLSKFLELKHEGLNEVTFMWDGEKSALIAAMESALMLHAHGIHARVAVLPEDKDPNEVPPHVVRDAYWKAMPATKANLVKLKMM